MTAHSSQSPTVGKSRFATHWQRLALLGFPISCLVATLMAFGWLQVQTTKAEKWVKHTQQVRLEGQQLLSNLLNAETAVRSFALTRRREFLDPYGNAIAKIPNSLDKLSQLVVDNSLQTQRLQQIRVLTKTRTAILQRTLKVIESQSTPTQPPTLTSAMLEGQRTMKQLRADIQSFLAEEERLQAERDKALETKIHLTWLILRLSAGIGIGGSLVVLYVMYRLEKRLREREQGLQENQIRLQRLNRALRTISECNQILVRATDETTLLQDICRIIIEFGGYRAVWIGFAEQDEAKSVRPVAQAGYSDEYLNSIQVTWSDTPSGRGPTGTAIRTGKVCIAQDIAHHHDYQLWRDTALKMGYAASIALPLSVNHQSLGALNIYATKPNAFDDEEVQLLTELANDVAYGIAALRNQRERQQAEASLRESEAKFRAFLELASEAVIISNDRGEIVVFNSKAEELFGYDHTEVVGNTIEFLMPERYCQQHIHHRADYQKNPVRRSMGKARNLYARRKDGSEFPIEAGLSTVEVNGETFILTFLTDISDRKQAEDLLRESEERFRSTFEQAAVGISHISLSGQFLRLNQRLCSITGYPLSELLTLSFQDITHPDDLAADLEQAQKLLAGEIGTYSMEKRYIRKDGSTIWINLTASLVRDRIGEPKYFISVIEDITPRKKAEEALRQAYQEMETRVAERTAELSQLTDQLQLELLERERTQHLLQEQAQLLDLAHDAILTCDLNSIITFWNRGAERMYRWTKAEALGKTSHELLQTQFPQPFAEIEAELLKTGYWEGELTHSRRDGTKIVVASRWVLNQDDKGRPIEILEINNEITHRKQAEEQLRLSSERISLANAELARAARLKDEFLAGMSHELRTPLNSILGLSEALLEEVYGDLTEKQRRSLKTIEQSGQHLLALINDILDLSKIESGKMELEIGPVAVQALCESSLSFVKQQAHHQNIRLNCQISPELREIQADERRIRQVLVNLLSNAVKFTPQGGSVQLQVSADSFHETVQLSVTDTGIGIAPEHIDKLFRPFVQIDSSLSRRYAGTGLGLVLVRRITELHGGSVALESELGKGSCFTITLPWQVPQSDARSSIDENLANFPLPAIHQALIVEDSEAAANQIARYLHEIGVETQIHPLGEGVLEVALQFKPDVIILDLLLPHRSGLEVLMELRENPLTQQIPIIVISVVDERSRCLELGASECLLKPISRQQFQMVLRGVFAPSKPLDEQTALIVAETKIQAAPVILLAEDNESNIATVMDYLEMHGLQIVLARNGLEAVQLAKQWQPDLILMDIQMPEMDGLEATRQIRADANLAAIPIIALTALAMPGDRERCLAVGATEYMTKPVSLKRLIGAIAKHLPSLRLQKDHEHTT